MDTRRDFIKKAALLAGTTGIGNVLPFSVQKALAINPEQGSTFYDAEHVVMLMQENRSFDHCFGTLRGVRGYNDPRAITLPDKNLVWLQSKASGETYAPFRLNIKDTKATWMSSLPHSWTNQLDAGNYGRHNRWLEAKRSGRKEFADMPLTLGHYSREDLPFYYALADAFTICDQHFCSSLTATMPNRIYFWTGTIRAQQKGESPANVNNSNVDYGSPASWITFPERLEEYGISWKIYQNELSVGVGFDDEEKDWLANFDDNPLEYFAQYQVRFSPAHIRYMRKRMTSLENELKSMPAASAEREKKQRLLDHIRTGLKKWSPENFNELTDHQKSLHNKAFTTNVNDPSYHKLASLKYDDEGISREMKIPAGDVLHQFREDVKSGNLPAVSWLVSGANFSDHPSNPWYGAWYVSEVLDILTQNPEIWKKTIFILNYDENDGYFDHVPPFAAPDPTNPGAGKCSEGIGTEVDYVTKELVNKLKGTPRYPEWSGPIGLGYRVPFIVASPWTRGGWVNSQVFDHTSVLQFLENFLTRKTGRPVIEENISPWRRTVCGDLTSVFHPYKGEKIALPAFVKEKPFVESIYNAQFKELPSDFKILTNNEIEHINRDASLSGLMPQQEEGVRSSCPLPYEIYADGQFHADRKVFEIKMRSGKEIFESHSAGAPFKVYEMKDFGIRDYAVASGAQVTDQWDMHGNSRPAEYHFRIYGPNGFYREYAGGGRDSNLDIRCEYERKNWNNKKLTGNIVLHITNQALNQDYTIVITDNAYKAKSITKILKTGNDVAIRLDLKRSFGWYDFTVSVPGHENYTARYAGHVETGEDSFSDPAMGRVKL